MMEQQPLTAADVGAVMRANGGYGYGFGGGYPMPVMPMYPAMGGYGGGFGNGFGFGGDFLSILLLFALFGGGWGGFGGFGGGFAGAGLGLTDGGLLGYAIGNNATKGDLSAGLTNVQNGSKLDNISTQISNGFANTSTQLCGGFADTATQLSNGFANVQNSICNTGNNINTGLLTGFANTNLANCQNTNAITSAIDNARFAQQQCCCDVKSEIANNRFTDLQNANAIQAQIAQNRFAQDQCCCENKAAIADLKYSVALENCADREAINMGIKDILVNQTANTQKILDTLCQDKIDAKNETIAQLRQELLYSRGQASQIEQTAQLRASLSTIPQTTYNLLETCPVSTTPVYGRTPIFTCTTNLAGNNWNNGCGCGSQFVA